MQLSDIKRQVDLHHLASYLGLERPDASGNYRSPHHKDKSPSLSVFMGNDGYQHWKDFSADTGGDCFDLVCHVEQCDAPAAIQKIRQIYNFPVQHVQQSQSAKLSTSEYIALQCSKEAQRAIAYLSEQRGIDTDVLKIAIERKTLGFNSYTNPTRQPGDVGYGGDAVAFICRCILDNTVKGVDFRYLEPSINGDVKTKSQGEKQGVVWTSCVHRLKHAHTVVIVESAINALSAETAWHKSKLKGYAALAIRGTANTDINWSFMVGKRAFLCLDNDKPIAEGPQAGRRPGLSAAWKVAEALTMINVPAMLVDMEAEEWIDVNDLNDYLKKYDAPATRLALEKLEHWMIPGLSGGDAPGKPRLFLPPHDYHVYWEYRCKPDFMSRIKITHDEDGKERKSFTDVAGFRIAALSRITIASAGATMTGVSDAQPTTVFAAAVQTPRHGNTLLRRVMNDDGLYTISNWNKFGPVFSQPSFLRALTIWERATHIGARNAANFVGLCYRDGKPTINEGNDCYFSDPAKQCPYHNLSFPSAPVSSAAGIILAYQQTMGNNAATMLLTWALGGHLKTFLGFWPHMMLQADKGSGKSTLIKSLEKSISFTMLSGQSLNTEFRLVTSVSHTSHPVGWEELSARRQDVIDKAVALLQETYQYTINRRGTEMTEYLLSAPVLLAGEDVPVDSLQGKLVRTQLKKQGTLLPDNMPHFPVRQWLLFLASLDQGRVKELHATARQKLQKRMAANSADNGASRMLNNYAALGTAWRLLCEFAGIAIEQEFFPDDLVAEMNAHIMETRASREPWVWILEIILGEIDRSEYKFPFKFEQQTNGDTWLLLRTTHCMQHLSQTGSLRQKFDGLPIKSAKVFSKQLAKSGVIAGENLERSIYRVRVGHLQALSLKALNEFGLSVSTPENFHDHH